VRAHWLSQHRARPYTAPMRQGRRSLTSEYVSVLRALYTQGPPELATVDDPAAFELLPEPWLSLLRAIERTPGAARVVHRALGILTRGLSFGVPLRSAFIDDALRNAPSRPRQLVILGAGLDGRAYRLPELAGVTVYEVDHPDTQAAKRDKVKLSPLAERVVYVGIDFEKESVDAALARAGHDAQAPTSFVWEGVTMYLTHEAVLGTLDAIGRAAAPGSRLIVSYLFPLHGTPLARRLGSLAARIVSESLHFTAATAELADLLAERGFQCTLDETTSDWAPRYWSEREARWVVDWERVMVADRR
jgi:methyltransferase (TIGR00027 family)